MLESDCLLTTCFFTKWKLTRLVRDCFNSEQLHTLFIGLRPVWYRDTWVSTTVKCSVSAQGSGCGPGWRKGTGKDYFFIRLYDKLHYKYKFLHYKYKCTVQPFPVVFEVQWQIPSLSQWWPSVISLDKHHLDHGDECLNVLCLQLWVMR